MPNSATHKAYHSGPTTSMKQEFSHKRNSIHGSGAINSMEDSYDNSYKNNIGSSGAYQGQPHRKNFKSCRTGGASKYQTTNNAYNNKSLEESSFDEESHTYGTG